MKNEVISALAAQLGIPIEQIDEECDIIADLGANSLDIVELITRYEDESGIELDDERVIECKTVADVIALLEGSAL